MNYSKENYEHLFNKGDKVYLNTASTSILPNSSIDAGINRLKELKELQGLAGKSYFAYEDQQEARNNLAKILGCDIGEIGLVKNTSEGLLIAANGVDFKAGDNVIIFENEFPANVYPWKNLKGQGVEVRIVEEKGKKYEIEDIIQNIDSRTKVLAISFVEFSTGYRNDLKAIGELCEKNGTIFVVDGIQGVGVLPLDVKECHIDFLSCGGYKWLCSGTGIGFIYVKRESMKKFQRYNFTYTGVPDIDNYLDQDQACWDTARRFESGIVNIIGIKIMNSSLKLILEIGLGEIYERVKMLTSYTVERVTELGYEVVTPRGESEDSGIMSFYSKDHDSEEIYEAMLKKNIIVGKRRGWVRLSNHFYNTKEELDQCFEVLKEMR